MTKKKKIIIAVISVVLAALLITSAIIVIMASKLKINNFDEMTYSSHTTAKSITLDNQYKRSFINTHYQNGTELIQNNDNKYGLFSNISGNIVVPTNFARYEHLHSNSETNKSYFKFYNTALDKDGFVVYDEHGNKVFDTQIQNNYPYIQKIEIKSKKVDVEDKYKIEDTTEDIDVENITFGGTYYSEDNYYYETWIITDKDGIEYTNLYTFEDCERKLVQTLGSTIGSQIDNNEDLASNIHFLKNGNPVFVTQENKVISSANIVLEIKVYNQKLKLKNKIEIENATSIYAKFRVGNYLFIQQINEGSEEEYDFSYAENGETFYYKLDTHKISLKSGKHTKVKTKLFIQNTINTSGSLNSNPLDVESTLLNAYVIENKEITTPILMIVNDQLKYKELDYTFDSITRISKNKYLVSDDNKDYAVINKNYEVVADLSKYTDVFTTEDCIIASDSNYTYICNHEGVVIKRYSIGSILNVNHSEYYMVLENDTENNVVNYKRGNLGEEYDIVLTLSNSGSDTIKETLNYTNVTTFIGDGYAYMLATKNEGSNSTYSIFNFEGTQLFTFEMASQSVTPTHVVYDDNVVIKISDYTILLDR